MNPQSITRRNLLAAAGAASLATVGPVRRGFAQPAPIKIGFVSSLSGTAAMLGNPQLIGAQIAVEEINRAGGVLGRPLELVIRDDKGNPNDGVAAVREIIGQGATMMCGFIVTTSLLAVLPVLKDSGSIAISGAPHGMNLTHENFVRNYFRITDNLYMRSLVGARLLAQRYPKTTDWSFIAPDSGFGRSANEYVRFGLAKYYQELDGQKPQLGELAIAKFGATDFRSQIGKMISQNPRGLFLHIYGADEVTFLLQAKQLGLLDNIEVFMDGGSELALLKALGKSTPKNFWVGTHWYYGAYQDIPMGRNFYETWVKRTGDKYPDGFACEGHSCIYAYANGIKRAGTIDTDAVIKAMEGMEFDTAKGKRIFRPEDHQAICDVNYMLAQPRDNELGFEVVDFLKVDGKMVMDEPSPGQPIKL